MSNGKKIVRRRRKKRKIKYFRILFLLLILFGMLYFLLNLGIFKISNIEIQGSKKVDQALILEKADYVLGDSVIFTSKKKLANAVKSIPYIESVKVKKRLPAKIILEVVERKPSIAVPYKDVFLLLDEKGVFLEETSSLMLDLTIMEKLEFSSMPVSGMNIDEYLVDENVAKFISLAVPNKAFKEFKKVSFEEERIGITLMDDIEVAFGGYNNIEYKLDVLNTILDKEQDRASINMILMEEGPGFILVRE